MKSSNTLLSAQIKNTTPVFHWGTQFAHKFDLSPFKTVLDAVQAKDPVHKNWDANITGADYYERVK